MYVLLRTEQRKKPEEIRMLEMQVLKLYDDDDD